MATPLPSALPVPRIEKRTYDQALPGLMRDHEGQFVVIHGDRLERFFDNRSEALAWAYDTYGLEPFFVKQISEAEAVAHFIRDLGPCAR